MRTPRTIQLTGLLTVLLAALALPACGDDDDATTDTTGDAVGDSGTGADTDTTGGDPLEVITERAIVVLVPTAESELAPLVDRLMDEPRAYLKNLTGIEPLVVPIAAPAPVDAQAFAAKAKAGLVVVFSAHTLAPAKVAPDTVTKLGADGFRIVVEEVTGFDNTLIAGGEGKAGATVVYIGAATRIATQYAWYELLRRLGARFYHPEEEFVPTIPAAAIRTRAATPTLIAREVKDPRDVSYTPDFAKRGYTFHTPHPLEHLESFSDSDFPIDEAAHVNEWSVKNFANDFRGTGRGVAPAERLARRAQELGDLQQLLGMGLIGGPGISLRSTQQGSKPDIDPNLDIPVQKQIEDFVAARMAESPNATTFGIHFAATEFTVSPDEETVQWINWAGQKALSIEPDLKVLINDHITGTQPVPNYDDLGCPTGTNDTGRIDFNDLPFHTDPRLGVSVHTVMFYPLEGPVPVYEQRTFAHKLCLMKKGSAAGRPISWFPESSWWLNFDNAVPVYLPLYIYRSFRDFQLVKPLLASRGTGTVFAHRLFNSGHEWGYWQQDYISGLKHWNIDASEDAVLAELADPFCAADAWPNSCAAKDEVVAIIEDVMDRQKVDFLDAKDARGIAGGLYSYFLGESTADLYADLAGIKFAQLRVPFTKVLAMKDSEAKALREIDLTALASMRDTYAAWTDRLNALEASVPEAGKPWLHEIRDGVEINSLRAKQAFELYDAVLTYRDAVKAQKADATAPDPATVARPLWEAAAATLDAARAVIARREAEYRYPAAQSYGGGMTPETAVPNGTTYGYRVFTTAHLLWYWTNRHEEVRQILDGELGGSAAGVTIDPAFAKPGTPVSIAWPAAAESASVALGDGATATKTTTTHDYPPGEAIYAITGAWTTGEQQIPVAGVVARTTHRAASAKDDFTLVSPTNPVAKLALEAVATGFELAAVLNTAKTAGTLAFGPVLVEGVGARFDQSTQVPFASLVEIPGTTGGQSFATAAVDFSLTVPDPATGAANYKVGMRNATLTGTLDAAGDFTGAVVLSGDIVLADIKALLVGFGAFDDKGADTILAQVLGFNPKDPPETFPVSAEITVTAAAE